MRTQAEVRAVEVLAAEGRNISEIARATGISRTTVRHWLRGAVPVKGRRYGTCPRCPDFEEVLPGITGFAYAYLLGMYLGDGCLLRHPRGVMRLNIALDAAYPAIIAECCAAASLVMPGRRVTALRHKVANMFNVTAYSKHWPHVFPQHGTGMKHQRAILLEPWQQRIVERYPGRLLRGLIQSDGCRVQNVIRHPKKTYSYPRYFFSNRSLDIQRIFTDACDQLGVMWRQDGAQNISVARRRSVAILDRHVGPKR